MSKYLTYALLLFVLLSQNIQAMRQAIKMSTPVYSYSSHSSESEQAAKETAKKAEEQRKEEELKAYLKAELERSCKKNNSQENEKISIIVSSHLALANNKEEKTATVIFEIPDKPQYILTQEEISRAKQMFQVYSCQNIGKYKIIHFHYQNRSLLPENNDQAIFLLYSPYLKNNPQESCSKEINCPLNEIQKKVMYNQSKNDYSKNSTVKEAPIKTTAREGLLGSTQVKTDTGYCKIEDLKVGDTVACYDIHNSKQTYSKITHADKLHLSKHIQITINNQTIHVAPEHKFYIPSSEAWVTAEDLITYPELRRFIDPNIQDVKEVNQALDVIRITVDSNHNFYITPGNILVHNSDVALQAISIVLEYISLTHPVLTTIGAGIALYSFGKKISNLAPNFQVKLQQMANLSKKDTQSTALQERNYFQTRKQTLSNLQQQLVQVKSDLKHLSQKFSNTGKVFTNHLLNYTQTKQDSFLEPSIEQELKLNENQKKDLSSLRQSQLDQYEKEIENLHLDIAFHINEFISSYAQNSQDCRNLIDKLQIGIDEWNNGTFALSRENLKNHYESIIKTESLLEEQKQKSAELQLLFNYYKDARNAEIMRQTSDINIAELEKSLNHAEQANSTNKTRLSDFKNGIQIWLSQSDNIAWIIENTKADIANKKNVQSSENSANATSKRSATQFPKPPENDKNKNDKEKNTENKRQFSDEAIEKGVENVMKNKNDLNHIFKPKHCLDPLLLHFKNNVRSLVTAVLMAADGKLPDSGIFKDIKIIIEGHEVFLRGCVHEGIPKLATFFIKYKK